MTRKKAIDILQGAIKKPNTKDGYLGQAIDMAINALEQEPCEDAISRQVVLDCLTANGLKKFDFILDARDKIKNLPSVKPQESKTGHWIRVTDKAGHLVWECDKCGWQQRYNTNFCPDCGVKMEGEDKE